MSQSEWRAIIAMHDRIVIVLFLAALGYAVNWYAWPGARRVLAWLAVASILGLFVANLIWR